MNRFFSSSGVPRGGSLRERTYSGDKQERAHHRRFSAHIVARRVGVAMVTVSLIVCVGVAMVTVSLIVCVGVAMVTVSLIVCIYYNVIILFVHAFLIPYLIMLVLAGKPMYFLELAVGQFGGVGPLGLWNCCPIAKGVGVAMVTVSLIVCIYYNVIMSYTLYYMFSSLQFDVPWSKCDPEWADMSTCYVRGVNSGNNSNSSSVSSYQSSNSSNSSLVYDNNNSIIFYNSTNVETASLQFWERKVLKLSDGIENLGPVKTDLAICLAVSWIVVVLCLMKGIKTSGKVVYFAATFPYVILVTLLVTGLLQDGAISGVLYFITPTWEKLLDIQVWHAAAGQMFFSLSVSMGGLIMYSSYNDFSNNVYRDALVVSVMDTITSIMSGIVTFSILGAMAHDLNVPINQVVKEGPGLAFVAYPEALLRLPFPQLWSILFFLMLFVLGLDSEFALLENVLTSVSDEFLVLRNHKLPFCICTALVCYVIGLSCVTHGGNYVLTLMDVYGGGTAVLFIAIFECVSLVWVYGLKNLCWDLKFMLKFQPGVYWRFTWVFCAPVILATIFIYSIIAHKPLHYENYDYPDWADGVGWCLACLSMCQIPFWALVVVLRAKGSSLKQKFLNAISPTEDWGPADPEIKKQWAEEKKNFEKVPMKPLNGEII
ncbi:sodium- and chloride-dependent glycine transporter 2-like [Diaphorina citri]|uniref:Sodium- and chloride-dependent glycine transporter 2-like n=1 Tax=Diaphorina citri TaxID=121845 RepID=A0A3Q0IRQ8_DIACI|nr:sodium- and chloride-dependent glycine transporter 2-like [Diaphorina citri]